MKELLKELTKDFGNYQTESGTMKFIFHISAPLFSVISNSIETVDIDNVYNQK